MNKSDPRKGKKQKEINMEEMKKIVEEILF